MKLIYFFIIGLCTIPACAQDSLISSELNELIIDNRLQTHNNSQNLRILSDSLIDKSAETLTDFLLTNSPVYFKENGAGMVSSPSFRGTTAQQTSVLWNGIEINSLLLGQSDFNSLSFKEYDNIAIKAGGGSVLYGSGAIGGTIHLNNTVQFTPHFNHQIQLSAGSFDTYRANYNVSAGNNRWFVQANYNHNQSQNDYEIKGRDWKNTNGEYENHSLSTTIAHRINRYNEIQFLSNYYQDERHFSLLSPYQNKSKYQNETARNLLIWKLNNHRLISNLRLGYLYEKFKYTENINTNSYSDGAVNTWLAKHDLDYQINERLSISSILYYKNHQNGGEKSSLENVNQNIFSAAILAKYTWKENSGIEAGLKREWADNYDSPMLFSAGWYQQFSKHYTSKIHLSKNFRAPTLNDIYWQPGGNKDLKPENSFQIDWGHTISIGKTTLQANVYWMKIDDMIRWLPTSGGFWAAENTEKVEIKGLEVDYHIPWKINSLSTEANIGYTFNESINKETGKLLVYTPKHKIFGGINLSFHDFLFSLQGYYNGKVYTSAENNEQSTIKPYGILHARLGYKFNEFVSLYFHIKNLTDSQYENMENRPMPGRNYNVQLIINL
ncbi:MAG TPA: TonB-dependent receptor [Flavobacterium sp.]|nr:TonB-dependent receptor [Flavobacterium sp.]